MSSRLAKKISKVPQLYDRGDDSTATLLKKTGYLQAPHALKVEDVEDALSQEPELAERWLERGQDQRLAGGWGIECEHGQYRVQSFGSGMHMLDVNRLHATAEFIVRYVRFVGDVLQRTH